MVGELFRKRSQTDQVTMRAVVVVVVVVLVDPDHCVASTTMLNGDGTSGWRGEEGIHLLPLP